MKDVESVKGKDVINTEFKFILKTVLELLKSGDDGKEKAIKYLNTLIDEDK